MILTIVIGIYVVAGVAGATVLFLRRPAERGTTRSDQPAVTVVVAARNEQENLPGCLSALGRQDFPDRLTTVVVVDDISDDQTGDIARTFAANNSRFRLLSQGEAKTGGKAYALASGIRSTRTEVVATTDADCRPPPSWLSGLVRVMHRTGRDLVCGPTLVVGESLTARIQRLDWMLLFGFAGAAALVGRPISAMGNNMAFRRDAYDAAGGYEQFASSPTEDYSFFRAVNRTKGAATLLPDAAIKSFTLSEPSLRMAFAQRKRWALGGLRAAWGVWMLYGLVWFAHAGALAALLTSLVAGGSALGLLLATDAVLIMAFARRTKEKVPWSAFIPFQLCLFTYILAMPIALLIGPEVEWKGRSYRSP